MAEDTKMQSRQWCGECKKLPDKACYDQHLVCILPPERLRMLQETKALLEAFVTSHNAITKHLIRQVREAEEKSTAVLDKLHDILALPSEEWKNDRKDIKKDLKEYRTSLDFDQTLQDP